MSTTVIIIIVVAAILLIGFILFFIFKGKKDDDDKPKPEPQPDPEPEPKPDPEPDPEPEPEPEPDPKPKPDPIPIPDPIFEVGDTITNGEITATIVSMNLGGYVLDTTPATFVSFRKQDEWKLVPKVDPDEIKDLLVNALSKFSPVLKVKEGTKVFDYLLKLVEESYYQFYLGESGYELPYMYDPKCFPYVYDYYGEKEEMEKVYQTMLGWLISLQLSELCPYLKNQLYKIGYELGGYTMNDYLYGYSFKGDPNVARLVASSIYVTMRGTQEPDIKTYREELGGTAYPGTLQQTYDKYSRNDVKDKDFFTDFRKFMNSAPGPYAPGYKDRSGINPTFPDQKASNGCLQVDMDLYNKIIVNNNLDEQTAVQATADEEADNHHVFGTDKRNVTGKYNFNAVFGETTLGEVLDPDSSLANFFSLVLSVGSSSRGILQHSKSSLGHYEYGRLRPGCSEQREAQRKSYTDDRYNVLACFDIENNDGAKETYYDGGVKKPYYDENGNWTNAKIQSKEDYENQSKDLLYANSYPSGHSSGMWCGALALMEIMPEKADLIMRAANSFAVNRTVARYHWNSDTIQGRVLGSATNAICHATSDYDDKVKVSRLDRKLQA